jgi:hypothetical protein
MSFTAASLAVLDTKARRQEYIFGVPSLLNNSLESTLNDPRDAPALFLLFNVCCLVLPGAVLLHLLPDAPHWLGAAYFFTTYGLFLQRFMLTLHFTQHRPLFKPGGPTAAPPATWQRIACGSCAWHTLHIGGPHLAGAAASVLPDV